MRFASSLSVRYSLLAAVFLLSACSQAHPAEYWSSDLQAREPFSAPYISVFARPDLEIWFVAVLHQHDVDSPSFKTIARALDTFRPSVMVLEGFPTAFGESPPFLASHANACFESAAHGCSEVLYAIYKGREVGTSFIGGEPALQEEFDEIVNASAREFGMYDFVGLQTARSLLMLQRSGMPVDQEAVHSIIERETEDLSEIFGWGISANRVVQWYADHVGGLDPLHLAERELAPRNDVSATRLQRLSFFTNYVRDRHLAEIVREISESHSRIMVVYGAAHLATLRPFLVELTGDSCSFKFY